MHFQVSISTTLILAFFVGCSGNSDPNDLKGRLRAAKAISETSKKNGALAAIAKEAGEIGEGDVAKNALSEITETTLRNSTAAEVAVALSDAGESDAAVDVAKTISEITMRNKTLEQIAEQ